MILPTMMVEIAASRDRVFSFMTNPEHVKQWQPDVVESIPLTKGGVQRGTRWRVTVEEFGRRFDVETSVVDLVLNTRLVFETSAPTADVQVDYRFFEHGPNTRVELATTLKPRGFMRVFFPFAKGMIRRKVASRLDLLREVIEATG
jgi:uncharacterized protein YndB with AHSA1/START domain